jgi:predicted GNAT family N-acyltransferase
VLELRYLANQAAGQIGEITTPEDTGDIHDARSRILVAKRNGKVIGTTRFRYTQLDEPLEAEKFVRWPASFPRRDQIFEMSRLATHPDYRRSDLLSGLFRFGCTTCVDADRPWLVMSSMEKYVGFYSKIGFRPTGLSYEDPQWSGRLNVMMVNYFDMIKGKGVHPAYWNEIWRDVAELAIRDGIVRLDGMDRVRIALFKCLRPVTRLMMQIQSAFSRGKS